ncbi:antibiotic biosynthesis monooxygenase, partial [Acinetobacter baumannii]|nr:antibiotic biosynthesis monooxygenase [Acinetobacter baumannii]
MIGITAVMTAQPGQGAALAEAMAKIAVEVVKEEGNHC